VVGIFHFFAAFNTAWLVFRISLFCTDCQKSYVDVAVGNG